MLLALLFCCSMITQTYGQSEVIPGTEFDSQDVENYDLENIQTIDEFFYIIEAFNLGFRIQIFFPAARDCTGASRIFLNDLNQTIEDATEQKFLEDTYDFLRNYTQLTSRQFANAYLYCHMTGVDVYDYYELQKENYGTWVDWLQAALQTMVGNIIRINNLYQKVVIATENKDIQQVYYIFGRIGYYLFDIQPIEEAAFDIDSLNDVDAMALDDGNTHASLTDVLHTFNKLMEMQGKINSGEIKIKDQHAAYERSKLEFKRLKEEEDRRERFKDYRHQSPALTTILYKYADAVKKSDESLPLHKFLSQHPIVMQDEANTDDNQQQLDPDEINTNQNLVDQILKYTEFTTLFLWEVQASTIGQISGNLSICQNNTLNVYKNSLGVYNKYRELELDEAGNSTYSILFSVDQIYTGCYYMFFEYYKALEVYIGTLIDINKLLYNFMHNLGSIYDLCEESYWRIVDFSKQGDTSQFWARMGYITGSNFHNLFEKPRNYEEVTNPYSYEREE